MTTGVSRVLSSFGLPIIFAQRFQRLWLMILGAGTFDLIQFRMEKYR
jgi:hypothetical protein